MECHKCVWNGRLGEFAGRPWAEVPCARCEYNPEAKTRYVLPVDEDALGEDERGESEEGRVKSGGKKDEGGRMKDEGGEGMDRGGLCEMPGPEIMEALGRVVDLLLRLTTKQYAVLRLRLAGKSFKEIGTELEISGNAAEKVFGHLLRARPLLRSLFPRRVVRGTRRRAAGCSPAELCRGEG